MKIFATNASGWVGTALTKKLVQEGHAVSALARSEASAEKVKQAGAEPVSGGLETLDVLRDNAKDAEAVVHTAFVHDFSDYPKCIEIEKKAVGALLDGLSGSGKTLVITSGLVGTGDEDTMPPSEGFKAMRGAVEDLVIERGEKENIRVCIVRLPPSVHGVGDKGFVTMLYNIAKAKGVSAYVDEGENRWAATHRDDAADAYVLALTKGPAGQRIHAVAEPEGVRLRDIAEAIGKQLNIPVKSVSSDPEAVQDHFGAFAHFVTLDLVVPPITLTQERLGWKPEGPTLLEDLANAEYFAA